MGKQKSHLKSVSVDYWRSEEGLILIEGWSRNGLIIEDICHNIGISHVTLFNWRNKYPEINDALKKGKEVADILVENALFKKAIGYKTTETKTIIDGYPDANGNRKIRTEKIEKEIAPDSTACMAWLNNRKPEDWKRNRDGIVELNDDQRNITIKVSTQKSSEEVKQVNTKDEDEEDWDNV